VTWWFGGTDHPSDGRREQADNRGGDALARATDQKATQRCVEGQQGNTNLSDLEDTIKRIQTHKGVTGIMIINSDGIAVRTTMDTTTTNAYSAVLSRLSDAARSAIRDLDPVNDISFIRMRSTKNEILLAPDDNLSLIVIQNPDAEKHL